VRLDTDFAQHYDTVFDDAGPVFHRRAFERGGLSKRAQFSLFDRLGLATPAHGVVKDWRAEHPAPCIWGGDLDRWWGQDLRLVVYRDEHAHGGHGKDLMPLDRALEECPEAYASLFIPPARHALNFRHIRIGRLGVWLRQQGGPGEWRSNRSDIENVLLQDRHEGPFSIPRALWAIDFIPAPDRLLAIDFNTAPDLSVLVEQPVVTPAQILEELNFAAQLAPESLDQF